MTARPVDIAPAGPVRFPDSGLGRGWESSAVIVLTAFLLVFGLVSLYPMTQRLFFFGTQGD